MTLGKPSKQNKRAKEKTLSEQGGGCLTSRVKLSNNWGLRGACRVKHSGKIIGINLYGHSFFYFTGVALEEF